MVAMVLRDKVENGCVARLSSRIHELWHKCFQNVIDMHSLFIAVVTESASPAEQNRRDVDPKIRQLHSIVG